MKKTIFWLLVLVITLVSISRCQAQTFTQVIQYPFVVTSLKYDNAGNEYVLRQQGSFTRNGDTLIVLPVHYQNECGAIDFDFIPEGFVFQLSSMDSTQRVIRYDTLLGVLDTILEVPYIAPFGTNHRGGSVIYRDSAIYCSFGYGNNFQDAQNLNNYKGKLVEIKDSTVGILAYGLRNPYRFSLQENDIYIGDVGWNNFEEINYASVLDTLNNYGWPCYEGDMEHSDTCEVSELPIYQYPHSGSQSVIGGCFFNGYWYWTDHFTGLGGKIDESGNNSPVDTFPQYVTSMAVHRLTNTLRMSTWGGWIYEMSDLPLSVDEEEEESVNYDSIRIAKEYEIWLHNTILNFGDVFFDVLGREYIGVPEVQGLYYSLWREKWILITNKA